MHHKRSGFTLVELLAVLGAGSIVVGIGVALLTLLFETEHTMRDWNRESSTTGRLVEQFRGDSHAALSFASAPSDESATDSQWKFLLPEGRQVIYQRQPTTLTRVMRQSDQILSRDSFPIPPQAVVTMTRDEAASTVTLQITREQPHDSPPLTLALALTADARLGSDHRWNRGEVQ